MIKRILLLILISLGASALKAQVAPPGGLPPIAAYSVWKENVDNKLWEMALPYGRWIVNHSPKNIEGYPAGRYNAPKQFERLVTVYENIAASKEDITQRTTYLDSSLYIFDLALETFESEELDYVDWKLQKGRFLQKHADYVTGGLGMAYELYEEVIMEDPKKITTIADGYYVQITLANLVSKSEKEDALAMIEATEPFASSKLIDVINNVRDKLFDSPEERIEFLQVQLEEDEENIEILSELAELYRRIELFEEATEIANKLYELAPTSANTFRLAKTDFDNGFYTKAIGYFNEVLNLTNDTDTLKDVNIKLAEAYKNTNQFSNARKHAREASKLDSKWGQPYILISEIYAAAVSDCSAGEVDRTDKAVYWLVLDYLDKAKSVDPSTASLVSRRYKSYTPVMPSVEDKFYQGWEKGVSFKIDSSLKDCYGWIGETTTIR
jgi:tetratricopeptide (TPR) repeat protein